MLLLLPHPRASILCTGIYSTMYLNMIIWTETMHSEIGGPCLENSLTHPPQKNVYLIKPSIHIIFFMYNTYKIRRGKFLLIYGQVYTKYVGKYVEKAEYLYHTSSLAAGGRLPVNNMRASQPFRNSKPNVQKPTVIFLFLCWRPAVWCGVRYSVVLAGTPINNQ